MVFLNPVQAPLVVFRIKGLRYLPHGPGCRGPFAGSRPPTGAIKQPTYNPSTLSLPYMYSLLRKNFTCCYRITLRNCYTYPLYYYMSKETTVILNPTLGNLSSNPKISTRVKPKLRVDRFWAAELHFLRSCPFDSPAFYFPTSFIPHMVVSLNRGTPIWTQNTLVLLMGTPKLPQNCTPN